MLCKCVAPLCPAMEGREEPEFECLSAALLFQLEISHHCKNVQNYINKSKKSALNRPQQAFISDIY